MTATTVQNPETAHPFELVDGDQELVLSTVITHRFLRTGSAVHHFLLAGDPSTSPVLLLGGRPESWWTWHSRIEALAARHFVVAPALLDGSLRASHVVSVLRDLALPAVHIVAEDEGQTLAADLMGTDGMHGRVVSFACLGTGPLAHLHDADLANRAIIEWLELREQTMEGIPDEGRVGPHVLEGA